MEILEKIKPQPRNGLTDKAGIKGVVIAELYDKNGELKLKQETHNLVTDVGDQYSAKKVAGASVTAMAGMKLGTSTLTPAKNGAGSFLSTTNYISGSAGTFEATYPKISATTLNAVEFKRTWAAGQGTSNTINEVAIVNNTTDAGEADATNTYSRAVFPTTIPKGADDTLAVTWIVTYTGS